MAFRLRPFTAEDWPAAVEISNRIFPDSPRSLEGALHWDSRWEEDKYFRERLVAENGEGKMVGRALLQHIPWQFSPDTYGFDAEVDPEWQRQGIGSALYDALLEAAQRRGAKLIRSGTKESKPESLAFLGKRGFEEIQRSWESRLDVTQFDFSAFAKAEPRVREQGLMVTTLEAELAAAGGAGSDEGEAVLRAVYELDCQCTEDEPSFEPITMPRFEKWRGDTLDAPNVLLDGYFLMKDGERYVGLSQLNKN